MLSHLYDPQIHLWCYTSRLYRGQHGRRAFSIHVFIDVSVINKHVFFFISSLPAKSVNRMQLAVSPSFGWPSLQIVTLPKDSSNVDHPPALSRLSLFPFSIISPSFIFQLKLMFELAALTISTKKFL